MNSRETAIELALKSVENGIPERKAAKDYGILRSTLYNRCSGHTDTYCGHCNNGSFYWDFFWTYLEFYGFLFSY
jgi:hypothetical protein